MILSTHHLGFLTNYKILTKRVDESSQRLRMSVFHGWHQHPPKEAGGKFLYLFPQKLASKNRNIQFWKSKYPVFEN
jgi:hypothetical protein